MSILWQISHNWRRFVTQNKYGMEIIMLAQSKGMKFFLLSKVILKNKIKSDS